MSSNSSTSAGAARRLHRSRVMYRDGLAPHPVRRGTHLLILACVMAFRGRWPGASRPHRSVEANAVPSAPVVAADDAAEVLEYLRRLEAQGSPASRPT